MCTEKNEMGEACSADGDVRKLCRVFGGNLRERDNWGEPEIFSPITFVFSKS
jgi:hypothetical protein